ncbi:DUF1513 domain-containing protein [Neptunomonas sp.]|uniref:DUF1513 domain-containing protein n=1 Tax=Neptunomonas sp. TaxID=1971898 RepID=UPI0025E99AB3|nr:DUF1513 domain-containing protein [Neptunomonas sp.]
MTAINRRTFLGWAAATPMLLHSPMGLAAVDNTAAQRFASASQAADGLFYLYLFDGLGQEVASHPLPSRAHQVIGHPTRPWVLVIARRPGNSIDVFNYKTGTLVTRINCIHGYHLYGHAQITQDGHYLLTTEKSPSHDNGRLVVRDITHHFNIVNEHSTAGIGPHELRLTPDQKTMVIANGGIKTKGRKKINLDVMQPSLVYVDIHSGKLLEQVQLPAEYHQSSIRHLDISPTGQVLLAMQYQGHLGDTVPLVALHSRGEEIKPLVIPIQVNGRLNQYCGSACFDSTGNFAAVSSPRGNLITLWNIKARQFHAAIKVNDGCGIAKGQHAGEFVISSGTGRLYTINSQKMIRTAIPTQLPVKWDNHLSPIS